MQAICGGGSCTVPAAEETHNPVRHLFLEADGEEDEDLVAKLQASVTELIGASEKVQSLEEHPLVRKVLHKYAKAKHSKGYAHPSYLLTDNSKSEVIAELSSVQGTPPTVRSHNVGS
jgi:hypothetical protein